MNEDLELAIFAEARRSVRCTIKSCVQRYAERPELLELLERGLSLTSPDLMIRVGRRLVEREINTPRPLSIVGNIQLYNYRAVVLLGRWRRLQQHYGRIAT